MNAFEEIYRSNAWGFGSGAGSLPSLTKGYRKFIETFVRENNIKSVVDYGCGDWQFSRFINWGGAVYTGLDVVETIIAANSRKYGRASVQFKILKSGLEDNVGGDLLIAKDVLQHLSQEEIDAFLKSVLPKFKYALITNDVMTSDMSKVNLPISSGEFRPLDLRKEPFCLEGKIVYAFSGPKSFSWAKCRFFPAWKKLVLLVG